MPGRDGTGPQGQGAMTGRGLGVANQALTQGIGRGRNPGCGMGLRQGRNPAAETGRGLGRGRGLGMNAGRGQGLGRGQGSCRKGQW